MKVDSGDVKVAGLRGPVVVKLGPGDVEVEVDSGDVDGSQLRGRARLDLDSGDLDCDLPLVVETDEDGASARGALGEGATARIGISTASGDIALRWGDG